MSRSANELQQTQKSCPQAQGLPLCKCPLIHLSCICPAVTPQALLSSTLSKALLFRGVATPAKTQNKKPSTFLSTVPRRWSSLTNAPFRRDRACVVHSEPAEKHLLPQGGSPVCVCVCVCVCVWLVSHAATVISMSAVCPSVRPDSDSDDFTAEWPAVWFSCQQGCV